MSKKEASVEELRDLAHALACCSRNQGNGCTRECPLHGKEHCLGVLFGACAEAVDELIERREEEAGHIIRRLKTGGHLIRQPRLTPSAVHVNNKPEQSSGVVHHPEGKAKKKGVEEMTLINVSEAIEGSMPVLAYTKKDGPDLPIYEGRRRTSGWGAR